MRRIQRHVTYANVVATLALLVAVGGGSAMALSGKNSVRSDDVKNGQITSKDLAPIRVATQSATLTDLAADGVWTYIRVEAKCLRGEQALGGGATNAVTGSPASIVQSNSIPGGWGVTAGSDSGTVAPVVATALCLRAKPAR
jgi:hypothetical protein